MLKAPCAFLYDLTFQVLGAYFLTSLRRIITYAAVKTNIIPSRSHDLHGIQQICRDINEITVLAAIYAPLLTLTDVVNGWNR